MSNTCRIKNKIPVNELFNLVYNEVKKHYPNLNLSIIPPEDDETGFKLNDLIIPMYFEDKYIRMQSTPESSLRKENEREVVEAFLNRTPAVILTPDLYVLYGNIYDGYSFIHGFIKNEIARFNKVKILDEGIGSYSPEDFYFDYNAYLDDRLNQRPPFHGYMPISPDSIETQIERYKEMQKKEFPGLFK